MLKEIGLTDYYFKELLIKSHKYLLLLLNGICNLNLKEEGLNENIITMHNNGDDIEMISKLLNLDLSYVEKVLSK